MKYLRRLLQKARDPAPRLAASRRPDFFEAESLIEERDEDVLSGAPAPRMDSAQAPDAPRSLERAPEKAPVAPAEPLRERALDAPNGSAEWVPAATSPELPPPIAPRRRARSAQSPESPPRPPAPAPRAFSPDPGDERDLDGGALVAPAAPRLGDSAPTVPRRRVEPTRREPPPSSPRALAEPASTVVNVVIGRIDVRAVAAAAVKPEPRGEPFRPKLTLEAFLGRDGAAR